LQSLISEFESAHLKGYPRNYAPEVLVANRKQIEVATDVVPANNSDDDEESIF